MFLLSFPPDICPSTQPANLCLSTLSLSVHTFTYLPFLPSSYPTLSDFLLPCSLYKSKKIKDSLVICSSLGIILIPDFHHVSLVFLVSLCCATAQHKVTFPSSPEEIILYQSIWQTDGCMDVGRVQRLICSQGHVEMIGNVGHISPSDMSSDWCVGDFLVLFMCCDNPVLNIYDILSCLLSLAQRRFDAWLLHFSLLTQC